MFHLLAHGKCSVSHWRGPSSCCLAPLPSSLESPWPGTACVPQSCYPCCLTQNWVPPEAWALQVSVLTHLHCSSQLFSPPCAHLLQLLEYLSTPACLFCCLRIGCGGGSPKGCGGRAPGGALLPPGVFSVSQLELGWTGCDLSLEYQPSLPNCRGTWALVLSGPWAW